MEGGFMEGVETQSEELMDSLKGLARGVITGSTYTNVNDFRAVLITTD